MCSFCGRAERKSRPLVAGPGVYICEPCIGLVGDVISTSTPAKTVAATVIAVAADRRERCSFCGKRRPQVKGLASTGDILICSGCLKLCEEIVAERLG